ncbi:Nonribosomal peptide synthetase aclP [Colletotrichum aenigma]|uniref:Nonribosomal peptide synthetase aclP n=1 Tax=Colletotrichum aenigma TaxID=1215731 RepID=UPI0018731453|nr:Nonribosomal peptide synthetase aclP [Colletotrichum aenigma]KAF5502476.1 Nonribosomal peptide synthetase aclP [Colletotrichum aenigma]
MAALRFCMECKRNDIFVPVDRVLSSGSVTELLRQCRPVSVCNNGKHPQIRTGHDASIRDNEPTRPREHFREVGSRSRLDEKAALWRENRNESSLRNAIDESLESNAGRLRPILTFTDEFCTGNHTVCDMSDIQISLVHGSLESPGANIIYYSEIHNPSHIFRLREAWMKACRAEPIFQTAYRIPDDGQEIRPRLCWREFKTKSRTAYRNALLQATGPGMPWPDNNGVDFGLRFTVLHYRTRRPADSKAAVIWAIHHALIDGWSAGLLVQKVHQMASGKPVPAHPGPAYVDLCRFQQELRLSRKAEGDLFWAEQSIKLATAYDELLIANAPNASVFTNNVWGKRDEMQVPVELAPTDHAAVKVAAQSCGVTPAAFFYAAWAVCLGLYASSDSVVIGAVVSGRNIGLAGIFDTIGPMVNTLPLQVDLDWQSSSRKLVEDVFARIQRLSYFSWTTPNNGFSRVRGNLMAFTPNPESWVKGAGVEQSFYKHTTNLPLNAIVKEDGGGMVIQYSAERYTTKAMETLASIFRASLLSLSRTEASLESLQLVLQTCGRSLGLMGNWKSFETTVPSVRDDLVTLFEDISTHYPGAIAVECGDQTITYCVVGDIYLAGVQVAIGYIGQPEITAERFLPDPFMKSGESMYQTGDRGYWDDSGDIVFLGRADRQTKLQGFRVDLEDLEARILRACGQQHGASAVAVTTQGDQLICMIQTNCGDLAGMRMAIRDALPPFAIPKHTLVTRQLPMTSNMKVDYRTIVQLVNDSSICHQNRPETNEISSTTRTEAVVAAIWAQILENEALSPRIGPDSNFIQLGGHSLQQLRLAAKLKSVFGVLITLRMIMNIPTLREFAAAIDKMDKMSLPPMAAEGRNDAWLGAFDPRPIEREWWRKYQLRSGTSAFNLKHGTLCWHDISSSDLVAAAVTIEDEKIDVTLGAPFLNRHSEADMEAVGLFLEPLPVRVHHVDTTSTLRSYLHTVQDSSQGALAHAVPWDQLLEYLGIDSGSQIPNHPIFDCVTSFHDARCNGSNNTQQSRCGPWDNAVWGDGVEPQLVWSDGAKFKLMVECLAYDDDTLLIRLEYDTACFEGSHRVYDARIKAVRRMILTSMTMIASPENGTVGGLRQGLRRLWEIEKRPGVKSVPSVDLLHPSEGLFMRRFSGLNNR